MPRELTPYADEHADPEASYRRGFQHGAAAVLQLVSGKLEPQDAQRISQWVGAELRDWRILGHGGGGLTFPAIVPAAGRYLLRVILSFTQCLFGRITFLAAALTSLRFVTARPRFQRSVAACSAFSRQ